MSVHDLTIEKVRRLPEPLVREVDDFVDFLLLKRGRDPGSPWHSHEEQAQLAEADFSDYNANLSDYEDRLARGEIRW